jgi:hypothetical protein
MQNAIGRLIASTPVPIVYDQAAGAPIGKRVQVACFAESAAFGVFHRPYVHFDCSVRSARTDDDQ